MNTKIIIKYKVSDAIIALSGLATSFTGSCSDDFLEVVNPTVNPWRNTTPPRSD